MRYLAAVIGVSALAACTPSALPSDRPLWHKLGDGSVFASAMRPDGKSEVVTRCWKTGRGIDCLNVERTPMLTMTRARLEELPAKLPMPIDMVDTGYSCSSTDENDFHEVILDDLRGELSSHAVALHSPDKKPWTRAFVERYLAENKVMGRGLYVNCPYLRNAIYAGNLHSVGTTSVSYNALIN
jgi:hypothetical protein